MSFENLSPEFQEKARACKSREELAELAAAMGVHLSDEELQSVAGGICKTDCPWDGAICRVDTNCVTKTSCPTKGNCKELFSCIPKDCADFSNPTPAPIPVPIEECTEFVPVG